MVNKSNTNTIQAAWVAIGGLFSIGFSIVSAMILSRYLSKEDYGLYKQVLYVYTSLSGLFVLGLPKAYSYFLPKSPLDEAKSLIDKITRLFFILGGALSLLFFFGSGIIAELLKSPQLAHLLKIFSPVPLLMIPTMGLEGILATYRQTRLITVYTIITRMGMLMCICLPIVMFDMGLQSAIVGFVVSSVISFVAALYLKYYPVRGYATNPTSETYKSIFAFCFPLFVASIWGILINSTDQFFISRYFGNNIFADFSNGAMELPFVGIIINSISTVLTPLFTRQLHEHTDLKTTVLPVWNNAVSKSIMLIYPLTIFCIFDAENIMVAMYGEQYIASADFFRIKLFTYFFKVIVFYSLIVALGATRFYQHLFGVIFLCLVISEYILVKLIPSPLLITTVHVLFSNISCIVMWIYIARAFNVNVRALIPIKVIGMVIVVSVLSCIIVGLIKSVLYSNIEALPTICLDILLMIIIYFVIASFTDLNYMMILKPLIKR